MKKFKNLVWITISIRKIEKKEQITKKVTFIIVICVAASIVLLRYFYKPIFISPQVFSEDLKSVFYEIGEAIMRKKNMPDILNDAAKYVFLGLESKRNF